jgi:hypothetical protein
MRPNSRYLISGSLLALCIAPALRAELPGANSQPRSDAVGTSHGVPTHQRTIQPTGSGAGAGMWIAPVDGLGFASAQLSDDAGNIRYTMRANLLPSGPVPPGMDEQGGFLGLLFEVDANGKKTQVAELTGKWIRHPNGFGEFGVEAMVVTGDRNQPMVSAGQIEGALLPPGILPGPSVEPAEGDDPDPAAPGELVLRWTLRID